MRRIYKNKFLSALYKSELDRWNSEGGDHPGDSPRFKRDVIMNLLYCQEGLCAYTEEILCDIQLLKEQNWENGVYVANRGKDNSNQNIYYNKEGLTIDYDCDLEHFDPELKEKKFWEWDNLFVIYKWTNEKKNAVKVYEIMKPDLPGYDPFNLLVYNISDHKFYANPKLEGEEERKVTWMIDALKLNRNRLPRKREEYLAEFLEKVGFDKKFKPKHYITACQMVLASKNIISREETEKCLGI